MKKRLIATILIGILMTTPVNAKVVTYEDDYISFDYSTNAKMKIIRNISDSEEYPLYYSVDTQMYSNTRTPYIYITVFLDDEEWRQKLANREGVLVVSEDPFETFYMGDDRFAHSKVIGESEDYVMRIDYSVPDENMDEYATMNAIYDTAKAKDDFAKNGFENNDIYSTTTIFSNVIYSDKGITYIQQAINICDGYLTGLIAGVEAEKRMKSIIDALEDLKENGDYNYDSDLYYAVIYEDKYFGWNDDAHIIDLKAELEDLIKDTDK